MKRIYLCLILVLFIVSCNMKYGVLEKYYKNNIILHRNLADSLMNFSKQYHTQVTMRYNMTETRSVVFLYSI